MDNNKKRFRAFENSIDAQVLVPGFNSEFNDFILSQTVVPVNKIGMHVNLDPFKTVEMLLHNYDGTPGNFTVTCRFSKDNFFNKSDFKDCFGLI